MLAHARRRPGRAPVHAARRGAVLTQAPTGVTQSVIGEAVQLYSLGVQGFFIDQPDLGVAAREMFLDLNQPLRSR